MCKYVRKSGDYIEEGMDAIGEEDARTSKKAIFSRQVMKATQPAQIKALVDEHPERLIGLHNIMKDYREYRNLAIEQKTHDNCRGIWIQGPPGIGKTWLARQHLTEGSLFMKPQNKWWDNYTAETTILLDDLDNSGGEYLGHYLKIWGDKYPFSAEVKGGQVKPEYNRFIVTSNYSIDEVFTSDKKD